MSNISREILEALLRNAGLLPPGSPSRPINIPTTGMPAPRRAPRTDPTMQPPSSVPPSVEITQDMLSPRVQQPTPPNWVIPPQIPPGTINPNPVPPPMIPPGSPRITPTGPSSPIPGTEVVPVPRSPLGEFEIPAPPNGWARDRNTLPPSLQRAVDANRPDTPSAPSQPGLVQRAIPPVVLGAGAAGLTASTPGGGNRPPNTEEVPQENTPPQQAAASGQMPTTRTNPLEEMLLQIISGQSAQNRGYTPQMITPDMLPDWQAVRNAIAAATPTEPEQISDNQRFNNALMAFLGNFQWRPGERIGASLARQGGAAVSQRMSDDNLNRQIRDVFRREQQAHRMATAQTEAQAQVGRSNALMQMIQANNAAQAQALTAANLADTRRLQAMSILQRLQAAQGQVSPEYILSRLIERASDPRTPFIVPGLDFEAARRAAIEELSPEIQRIVNSGFFNNPGLQAAINQGVARHLMQQFIALPPERQMQILMRYRALATQRPRANAELED